MIRCIQTNSDNPDFQQLVIKLDRDLKIRDGEDHSFYAQFNKIDAIKHVVIAYDGDEAVGCGAIKAFAENAMEVKRMYVLEDRRGVGIASIVLQQLEQWALALNCTRCLLETGQKQPEAIKLYTKNGYHVIPNFGQYTGVANSICFEKKLAI